VNFEEALKSEANLYQPARRERTNAPSGFEPGIRYESSGVQVITTPPMEHLANEDDWQRAVAALGVEVPSGWRLRLVEARYDPAAWHRDAVGEDAVTRPVWRYRFAVEPDTSAALDLDELVKAAKVKAGKKQAPTGDRAFLVALGDLQLGKMDGDGVEGTYSRFYECTEAAVKRLKQLRKQQSIGPIYLAHLGDCIEGFVSRGGANTWRTTLTLTEQVRLYRRMLLEQIKLLAPLTDQLVVAGIPGNHDEANRPLHTYGDSWAIEAAVQVADALSLSGNYDHVSVVVPERDELSVTLDMCGTMVGMVHGHQFRRGDAIKWWAGQAHGRHMIGDADLLIAGHKHHLRVEDSAPRTFIQVPSLEAESTWYRHSTGQGGNPGIVTMTVGGGSWADLQVHRGTVGTA
jgi:predicted phosphodiesterase